MSGAPSVNWNWDFIPIGSTALLGAVGMGVMGKKLEEGKDECVHGLRNTLGLDLAWVSFRY